MIIYSICKNGNFELKTELIFLPNRRYRFDWALPSLKIAIEYEGLQSDFSGHTTFVGYSKNCTKYNLALVNGWKVLRYTAYNYKSAGSDLLELINKSYKQQL